MTLGELFDGAPLAEPLSVELSTASVTGLAYDSRRVLPGYAFFAFPGQKADGLAFAADAAVRGAIAVVSQSEKPPGFAGNWIQAVHGRQALAIAARNFYGRPDERIALIGITGTNGKTTCSYLIDSVLRAAGRVTLLVGTIEYRLAGKVLPAVNTTPESLDLMLLLAELERLGGTHATMEVSS
ncbi:MAG: Mur ligase family protein, partial [Bryobacteraceae bacterium]